MSIDDDDDDSERGYLEDIYRHLFGVTPCDDLKSYDMTFKSIQEIKRLKLTTESEENVTIIARSIGRTVSEVNHHVRAKDVIRSLQERDLAKPK